MSNPSGSVLYGVGGNYPLGNSGALPYVTTRDPTSTDITGPWGSWRLGQVWINKTDNDAFALTSFSASNGSITATWTNLGAASGTVSELDGDSGTANPSGGAIVIAGTAGEIETTGAGDTITLAFANPTTLPGNVTVTGTLGVTGATTLAALTQVGTASINETGSATTTIGSAAAGAISLDTTDGVTINADTASSFTTTDAGADLSLTSTLGRVIVTAGEDAADAIYLHADAGTSETIRIHSDQGTGVASVQLLSDVGGVTLTSGLASSDAINLTASAGGVDVDAALDIVLTSTEDAADSILLHANGGTSETIRLHADQGTGAASVHLESDVGGVTLTSGLASSDAINFSATAGGIDMDAALDVVITSTEDAADSILLHANGGTSEQIRLHADQGTGVGSVQLESDVGGITLLSGLASTDSINITSSAGGIDVDGALEINIASSEAAATAVNIVASNAAGGVTLSAGTGNVNVSGNLVLSDVATQLQMNGGAVTDFIGTATLSSGTITVANTNIAATDRIFIQRQDINGSSAVGQLTYSISASTSFTITAVQPGTPGSTETNDASIVMYWIVRQN